MANIVEKQIDKYKAKRSKIKHVCIVCDAYEPENIKKRTRLRFWKNNEKKKLISGVQNHTKYTEETLKKMGYEVTVLNPYTESILGPIYKTVELPLDKHLGVVVNPFTPTSKFLKNTRPDAIFVTTPEGPLGIATLFTCIGSSRLTKHKRIPFTASYHTNIDIYINHKVKEMTKGMLEISEEFLHPLTNILYKNAYKVLVPTQEIENKVKKIGIKNTKVWPRGVDSKLFRPLYAGEESAYEKYSWYKKAPHKKVLLNFGRISVEKNIEDFLDMDYDAHKVVIGDGPYLDTLKKKYHRDKNIHFLGAMFGEKLAVHVRSADLMIFPSKFDTFGNVITEAGASGVPTLAYKVQGPKDVIIDGKMGVVVSEHKSLVTGIEPALKINKDLCRETTVKNYSWEKSTKILLNNLYRISWR